MNRKICSAVLAAALSLTGTALIGGTAFATGSHNDNREHNDSHDRNDSHERDGGNGGRGGKNRSECAAPVGLSAGALASSGGDVNQCNSQGAGGGRGGSGDVDY